MIDAILGLDVGTTTTKVVLFDLTGAELARSMSKPYRNYTPRPGWVEQDPEILLASTRTVLNEVLTQHTSAAHDIAAIGLTNAN